MEKTSSSIFCPIILIIFSAIHGSTNWELIDSKVTNDLNKVFFASAGTGYIAGSKGVLLVTQDTGKTWRRQDLGIPQDLLCGYFLDSKVGFVGGSGGLLMKTTDSGNNWTKISLSDTSSLTDIVFATPAKGFAAGGLKFLLATIDSGRTWSKVDLSNMIYGHTNSLCFPSPMIGFVISGIGSIKTTDGGETWRAIPSLAGLGNLTDCYFLSVDTGFIVERSYPNTFLTFDQAITFKWISGKSSNAISFVTHEVGYIVETQRIFRTSNLGQTWQLENAVPLPLNGATEYLKDVFGFGGNVVLAVGKSGFILRKEESNSTLLIESRSNGVANRLTGKRNGFSADGRVSANKKRSIMGLLGLK